MSKITGFQETNPNPEAQQGRRLLSYPNPEAGSYSFATLSGHMQNKSRPFMDGKLKLSQNHDAHKCPQCESFNTKFCYYNNYSLSQPRYFCKACRRYWTQGLTIPGSLQKKRKISSEKSNIPSLGDTNYYLYPPANISHQNNTNSYKVIDLQMQINKDVKRKVVDELDIKQKSDQVLWEKRESMREPVILDKVCEMVLATSTQGALSLVSSGSPVFWIIVAANGIAFSASLISMCLRAKKPKSSSFLAKVGTGALVIAVMTVTALYRPFFVKCLVAFAAAIPIGAVVYA